MIIHALEIGRSEYKLEHQKGVTQEREKGTLEKGNVRKGEHQTGGHQKRRKR